MIDEQVTQRHSKVMSSRAQNRRHNQQRCTRAATNGKYSQSNGSEEDLGEKVGVSGGACDGAVLE